MIIKKCYISSFGKLRDKTFTFEKGINTIKEENGAGKTTLSIFIKSMFYGLNDGKRNIKYNERKKYQLWNSSDFFGGYIEFCFKDKDYRIERFFGKKESEDTVKLIDIATMKEYKSNDSLGERLFGIDENGFLATCFMGQNDFMNIDSESVISKFNNICETNDSNTYEDARKLIDDEIKKYKQRGDKGIINEKQRQIYSLNQEIENLNSIEGALEKLKEEQREQEDEISFIKNQINELQSSIKIAGKYDSIKQKKQSIHKLEDEKQKLLNRNDEIFKTINGKFMLESDYNLLCDLYNDYIKLKSKVDFKNEEVKKQTSQKNNFPLYVGVAIVLLAVIIAGIFTTQILSIVGGTLAVMFLGLYFAYRRKTSANIRDKNIDSEDDKLLSVTFDKMEKIFNDYGYTANTENFLSLINKVKDYTKDYDNTTSRIKAIEKEIEELSLNGQEIKDIENVGDYNVLTQNFNSKNDLLTFKNQQLEIKKRRIDELNDKYSTIKDLESKRDELVVSIKEDEEQYTILVKALEYLEMADEQLKLKYREPLTNSFNKYLQCVSPTLSAVIDIDLAIKIEEKGTLKESAFYSSGYQDLFEICKRLALVDTLFTSEKPFILLDDVFFNLDDEKIKTAIETIKKLAENYQIIYFVCHESRRA